MALKGLSRSEKKKKAIKLQQFAYCSKERLINLVKESKNFDDKEFLEILEECYDNCEFCQQTKNAPLTPAVSISLAENSIRWSVWILRNTHIMSHGFYT